MTETRLVHSVDDEHPNRHSPDLMLHTAGYRVETWTTGEAFLHGADPADPACVLLNLRLPGLGVLEVQARMARSRLDFPIIMMTGHDDIALAIRAINAGAADILESPCDPEKLLRALEVAFSQLAGRESHRGRAQSARTQLARLSHRERHVLERLACGYPNQTIARALWVGVPAVEAHRDDIVTKLGLGNFQDALRVAFAAGLGADPDGAWGKHCEPGAA